MAIVDTFPWLLHDVGSHVQTAKNWKNLPSDFEQGQKPRHQFERNGRPTDVGTPPIVFHNTNGLRDHARYDGGQLQQGLHHAGKQEHDYGPRLLNNLANFWILLMNTPQSATLRES